MIGTSTDGLTWAFQNSGTTGALTSITYGLGQFTVLSGNSTILTSPDGAAWKISSISPDAHLETIVSGKNQFVALNENMIWSSSDGLTWQKQFESNRRLSLPFYSNGRFFLSGGGFAIFSSTEDIPSGVSRADAGAFKNELPKIVYANDRISILIPGSRMAKGKRYDVGLFNLAGNNVYSAVRGSENGNITLSSSAFPRGKYFLSVKDGKERILSSSFVLTR